MIARIVLAVVVGVVVGLACLLLGNVLELLKVDIATTVGGFLVTWAWVFGVLAAIWYFFKGALP